MSCHAAALAQAKSLEEVSDENMVHYFTPELIWIGEGQKAKNLLPDSVILSFVRIGVLEYLRGHGGHTLTDKALDILHDPLV